MKKRIFCLVLVALLLGLYLTTFIVAIFTTKETGGLFMACLFSTVAVPVLLYGYHIILKVLQNDKDEANKKQ